MTKRYIYCHKKWEYDEENDNALHNMGYDRTFENICITCKHWEECNKGN